MGLHVCMDTLILKMKNWKSKNSIVFCQGDKKELEGITGKTYEFLDINEIVTKEDLETFDGEILPTFIYTYARAEDDHPLSHETLMDRLGSKAREIGADAVIHFHSTTFENAYSLCYARGTPMRKKKY